MSGEPLIRVGELARRAGIPPATLRAWERRYGIVEPTRTEAGYRLYSARDEARLKAMIGLITEGAAPAEAAARALAAEAAAGVPPGADELGTNGADPESLRGELLDCFRGFDDDGSQRLIDHAVAAFSTETLIVGVLMPVLRDTADLTIGQEHFASNLIRGRILGLARGWGRGAGPQVLLACPQGEVHDLGLIGFGLLLREHGWRIAFLGADTPIATVRVTAERLRPAAVVLAVTSLEAAAELAAEAPLELVPPLSLAGSAASLELAGRLGATLLPERMPAAVGELAAAWPARSAGRQ